MQGFESLGMRLRDSRLLYHSPLPRFGVRRVASVSWLSAWESRLVLSCQVLEWSLLQLLLKQSPSREDAVHKPCCSNRKAKSIPKIGGNRCQLPRTSMRNMAAVQAAETKAGCPTQPSRPRSISYSTEQPFLRGIPRLSETLLH